MGALMKDVALVPDCAFNLFSISNHLKEGWKLGGAEDTLILMSQDGKYIIKLNITVSMLNGKLYAICIMQTQEEVAAVMTTNSNVMKQVTMMVQQAHERLGHINERTTKEITKALEWKLTNVTKLNCASCAAGKVKQKSLEKIKIVDPDNEKEGYRAYLDLSIKKNEKYLYPSNPNWQLILVGMKLQLKFSHFYPSKSAMVKPTCELLPCWGQAGKIISKLQMDNAGENKKLVMELQSASWRNPVAVEYTTRDTPQQNSLVEVAFYALANKAHATMHHANLPMEMWYHLFGDIFTIVMLLDGLTVIKLSGKCTNRYKHFFRETPKFVHSLHTVGEAGTVKIETDTTPKLEDHGIHCLFMGYSLSHPSRCY